MKINLKPLLNLVLATMICLPPSLAWAQSVLIPAESIQGGEGARFFIVAIGVDRFDDEFWPRLKWTVKDAKRMSQKLGRDMEAKREVFLITGKKATRKHINKVLEKVRKQATPRDIVVLYVSSHGTLTKSAEDLERVVVLKDTNQSKLLSTGLPHRHLVRWLEKLRARRKMMMFATCHSGLGKSKLPDKVQEVLASRKGSIAPLEAVSEGSLVLAASAQGEAARENDRLKGDIYTHFFLQGLEIYDRNQDGVMTALEAHDYAKERTYDFTEGRQRPTAEAKLIGDADIPLFGRKKREGLPVLEAYDEDWAGFSIRLDNGVKGQLPMAFPLNDGDTKVQLLDPQGKTVLAAYRVEAGSGDRIQLDDVVAGPPYSLTVLYGLEHWNSEAMEKVWGSQILLSTEFIASFRTGRWHWKLGVQTVGGLTENIRPGLESTFNRRGQYVGMGYEFKPLPALSLMPSLTVGEEFAMVKFEDVDSGDAVENKQTSRRYGGAMEISYQVRGFLQFGANLGYKTSRYEYDDLGELDGTRWFYGALIRYRFGGVGEAL